MTKYMIELHLVPHEIAMYLGEIEMYGEITHYNEHYPTYVWIEAPWDKDIIERIYGIKKVWEPLIRTTNTESILRDITHQRGLM